MQLVIGMKTRQFFEPNCKSPGSLNRPRLPSNKKSSPSRTTVIPMAIRSLPICCGPKSIRVAFCVLRRATNFRNTHHERRTTNCSPALFLLVKDKQKSGRQDSNLRPLAPHASALAKLRHAPIKSSFYLSWSQFNTITRTCDPP
jgi:hypothetical protein